MQTFVNPFISSFVPGPFNSIYPNYSNTPFGMIPTIIPTNTFGVPSLWNQNSLGQLPFQSQFVRSAWNQNLNQSNQGWNPIWNQNWNQIGTQLPYVQNIIPQHMIPQSFVPQYGNQYGNLFAAGPHGTCNSTGCVSSFIPNYTQQSVPFVNTMNPFVNTTGINSTWTNGYTTFPQTNLLSQFVAQQNLPFAQFPSHTNTIPQFINQSTLTGVPNTTFPFPGIQQPVWNQPFAGNNTPGYTQGFVQGQLTNPLNGAFQQGLNTTSGFSYPTANFATPTFTPGFTPNFTSAYANGITNPITIDGTEAQKRVPVAR